MAQLMQHGQRSKLITEEERKMLKQFPPPFENTFAYFIQPNQIPCFVRLTSKGPEKRSLHCDSVFSSHQPVELAGQMYTAETNPMITKKKVHVKNKLLIAAMHPESTMTFEQIFNVNTGETIKYDEQKLNPSIDHIDGNPTNDAAINLRVIPNGENSRKGGPKQDGAKNSFYYFIGTERADPTNMSLWQFSEFAKQLEWMRPYNAYLHNGNDSQTIQALLGEIPFMQLPEGLEDSRCWIHPVDIEKRSSIKTEFKNSGAVEILSHATKGRNVLVDRNGFILRYGESQPKRGLSYKNSTTLETKFDGTSVADMVYGAFADDSKQEPKIIRRDYKHDCTTGVKLFLCNSDYEVDPLENPVDVSFLDYLEAHEYSVAEDDAQLRLYVRPLYTNEINTLFPMDSPDVYDVTKAKFDYQQLKQRGLHTFVVGETRLTDAMAIYCHQSSNMKAYKEKANESCEVIDERGNKRSKLQ